MVKFFEVTCELCVAVFLCFISYCWSRPSTVYKYLTLEDGSRLIEAELDVNGRYIDCAVFADSFVIEDILKNVPMENVIEMSRENIDLSTKTCHDLHLTLEDSPLRKKRALAAIYPGTKWCGVHNISEHDDDLGVYNSTDACCREHDHCHDCIGAYETKHGFYNWRPYSICDCNCDERFYQCLTTANDGAASYVGSLYFNIIGMKCMVDVHPQICVKYWWFICTEYAEDTTKTEKQYFSSPWF